jgi:hypothetical protein
MELVLDFTVLPSYAKLKEEKLSLLNQQAN